jgi:hypothetical protein
MRNPVLNAPLARAEYSGGIRQETRMNPAPAAPV